MGVFSSHHIALYRIISHCIALFHTNGAVMTGKEFRQRRKIAGYTAREIVEHLEKHGLTCSMSFIYSLDAKQHVPERVAELAEKLPGMVAAGKLSGLNGLAGADIENTITHGTRTGSPLGVLKHFLDKEKSDGKEG